VGDIFHHVDGKISDLDELTKEIIDIEKMADEDGKVDESIKKDLSQMKIVLGKIRSSEEKKPEEASNEDTGK
jgi:DNA gyrase/topoisomerase IV subunit A